MFLTVDEATLDNQNDGHVSIFITVCIFEVIWNGLNV